MILSADTAMKSSQSVRHGDSLQPSHWYHKRYVVTQWPGAERAKTFKRGSLFEFVAHVLDKGNHATR